MNVQRLIEKYKKLEGVWDAEGAESARKIFLMDLEQLDEPKPVKVPQCVADYIEESRLKGWDLLASMCFVVSAKNKKTTKWFYLGENKNIFALAWIFGYEVEKEKRYLVKIKATKHYFAKDGNGKIFFSLAFKGCFTKKELEEADLGWVFDCPGINIKEAE